MFRSRQHHSSQASQTNSTDMKLLLLTLSLVGCSLAEAPYPASGDKPQGALLLLPPDSRQPSTTWSSFQTSEAEDLSKVNDKVMERLRQEAGSDSGSYHVYLADGRLQKVQYTTAPVQSGQQGAQLSGKNSVLSGNQRYSGQYEQGSFGSDGGFSGSSPVIVDTERYSSDRERQLSERYLSNQNSEIQRYSERQQNFGSQAYSERQQNGQYARPQESEALRYPSEQESQSNERYTNQQNSEVEGYTERQQSFGSQAYSGRQQNGQYSGQDSEELNPVIAQFGKLQQQLQQLLQRQQQLEQEQQKLREQQEQLRSASYVASLQYSNVEPITSPVYSYKPSPVTRILRYAPQF